MDALSLTPQQIATIFNYGRKRRNDGASQEPEAGPPRSRYEDLQACLVWDDECGLTAGLSHDEKQAWWSRFEASLPDHPKSRAGELQD